MMWLKLTSQFSLTHTYRTKKIINGKTKTKPLSSPESVKVVRWVGEDLWWEGLVEKMCFELGVKESASDGWWEW